MGTYEVKAELVIDDKKARKAIARINRGLGGLIKQLDLVNKKMARMGTVMAKVQKKTGGMAGAGKGKRAAGGGGGAGQYLAAGMAAGVLMGGARFMSNQISAASEFRKEMEMGQLGLATMYNLVDGLPIAKSMKKATNQMVKFNVMAAQAPGSGKDMLDIYTRLYGPMKKLGVTSKAIEESVKGAAVMGKAFGIKDVGSLGRDVEEMLTGRAGKRTTKIFALANAWGLMNMEAREFNRLSPEKRLEMTMDLMGKFKKFGVLMAKTWEGSSDAFLGFANIIRDFAAEGVFTELGKQLYKFNQLIEKNIPAIRSYMQMAGASGAAVIQAVGTTGGAMAKGSSMTGLVAGEAALGGGMFATIAAFGVLILGLVGIFAEAGTLAAIFAGALSFGLLPILAIIVGIVALATAAFEVFTDQADILGKLFGTMLGGVLGVTIHILSSAFWGLVALFKTLISIVAFGLLIPFAALYAIFLVVAHAVLLVVEAMRVIFEAFYQFFRLFTGDDAQSLSDAMTGILEDFQYFTAHMVRGFSSFFSEIANMLARLLDTSTTLENPMSAAMYDLGAILKFQGEESFKRLMGMEFGLGGEDGEGVPKTGQKQFQAPAEINVQRMIINQEFKGKADPDRVVASFLRAVTDQAEGALSSSQDLPGRA